MRKTRRYSAFRVRVACSTDERLRDRYYVNGHRRLITYKLPVRGDYIIESVGNGAIAEKKAIRTARQEGIESPVVLSVENLTEMGRSR